MFLCFLKFCNFDVQYKVSKGHWDLRCLISFFFFFPNQQRTKELEMVLNVPIFDEGINFATVVTSGKSFCNLPPPTTATTKNPEVKIYTKDTWNKITPIHTNMLLLNWKGGKPVQHSWVFLYAFSVEVNGYVELSDGWLHGKCRKILYTC